MVDTTETTTGASTTQLTGRVKWFNNKAGYGFITVTGEGEFSGKDVFVHHSAIRTTDEQYKYLVQGEYVNFTLSECGDNADHEHQADSVCGMFGGKLMCETRNENRTTRSSTGGDESGDNSGSGSSSRSRGGRRTQGGRGSGGSSGKYTRVAVHVRGTGPRENEEWMLVRRNKRSSRGPSNNRRSSDNNSTVDDA